MPRKIPTNASADKRYRDAVTTVAGTMFGLDMATIFHDAIYDEGRRSKISAVCAAVGVGGALGYGVGIVSHAFPTFGVLVSTWCLFAWTKGNAK